MTRVKICGLTRLTDVEAAEELGADALGFVLEPSSPRCITSFDELRILAHSTGPYCTAVAVFGVMPAVLSEEIGVQAVQALAFSHTMPPYLKVRAVRVGETSHEVPLAALDPEDSAIVLDAHDTKSLGGTGKRIDWDLARAVVQASPKPVILAGGLTPDNVAEAIRTVRPYAVDVSSGVESSPGIKDPIKIRDFIQAVREAL